MPVLVLHTTQSTCKKINVKCLTFHYLYVTIPMSNAAAEDGFRLLYE